MRKRETRRQHWYMRCRKVVTEEESRQAIDRYGKPLFLYQREKKKLISLSYRDFDRQEELLEQKLARYVPSP